MSGLREQRLRALADEIEAENVYDGAPDRIRAVLDATAEAPGNETGGCDGSGRCEATVHMHGYCFADIDGFLCDYPGGHESLLAEAPGSKACACPPCPGRGNDGHGLTHCAECCFGTGVEADIDCPIHGERAADARPVAETLAKHRLHAAGDCECGRWEVPDNEPWVTSYERHVAAVLAESEQARTEVAVREALEGAAQRMAEERDGYLASFSLAPAWIAGWHSATDHHARIVREVKRPGAGA